VKSDNSKNIVYIGYAPLTVKTAKDFFISDLIKEGLDVEYWDFSSYYFNKLVISDSIIDQWITRVNSMREFKVLLASRQNNNTIYFINFPFTGKVMKLFWILTKARATIFIIARGMIPMPASTVKKSVIKLFKPGVLKKVSNFALNRLALLVKKMGLIKPFDRIYYAGDEALKIAGMGYEMDKMSAELIAVNSSDYDNYLAVKYCNRLVTYQYVVFLDEYLPHHPDAQMFGLSTVNADEYYQLLNQFFDNIEEEFGVKVVIAAHPKAELYHTADYFKQREVFFYKTAELIKYANFVLAHRSTAVSFAVLFKKKLIFMYTDYMKEKMAYYYEGMSHMAKTLGADMINISAPVSLKQEDLAYDEKMYNDFKYRFLTSKTIEDIATRDIFINSIKI
jgi:hypothetical protein